MIAYEQEFRDYLQAERLAKRTRTNYLSWLRIIARDLVIKINPQTLKDGQGVDLLVARMSTRFNAFHRKDARCVLKRYLRFIDVHLNGAKGLAGSSRSNRAACQRACDTFLPNLISRRTCLKALCDSIEIAHDLAPDKW